MTSLTSNSQYNCDLNTITASKNAHIHDSFSSLFSQSGLNALLIETFSTWLNTKQPDLKKKLIRYFENPNTSQFTPLFLYHEPSNRMITLLANRNETPSQPGEWGSILAYVRQHEYDDSVLCSDCFGQLSCSSCAVEVLAGKPQNTIPREEEYDMLDIDEDRPPTPFTRLGCQAVIGSDALIIKIR